MNPNRFIVLAAVAIVSCFLASARAEEKTVGEKTSEAWDATKETTKDVSRKVVRKTKETAAKMEAAVTKPDADARKVQVTVSEKGVRMPSSVSAGKTAFIVRNTGKQEHNFEIKGNSLDKSFWFNLSPDQSKTMKVELKAGTYEAACQVKEHQGKESKVRLMVK